MRLRPFCQTLPVQGRGRYLQSNSPGECWNRTLCTCWGIPPGKKDTLLKSNSREGFGEDGALGHTGATAVRGEKGNV